MAPLPLLWASSSSSLGALERQLRGVGVLAAGLHRVGYDLSLIQHADEGWNATFFVTGRRHSIAGGWANATTPWRAAQRAGWDAIQHAERFL